MTARMFVLAGPAAPDEVRRFVEEEAARNGAALVFEPRRTEAEVSWWAWRDAEDGTLRAQLVDDAPLGLWRLDLDHWLGGAEAERAVGRRFAALDPADLASEALDDPSHGGRLQVAAMANAHALPAELAGLISEKIASEDRADVRSGVLAAGFAPRPEFLAPLQLAAARLASNDPLSAGIAMLAEAIRTGRPIGL